MASSPPVIDHSRDNESRRPYIVSVLTVVCVLSTIATVLRLYTRLRILRTFWADDVFIAFAQVLTLASAVTLFSESAFGMGRHIWMMPPDDYIPYMKSFYSSIIVYNVGTCVVKISILIQYWRIFTFPAMRRITIAMLTIEGLWAVILSILLPLPCIPVAAFWDSSVKGICINSVALWYFMAAMNLAGDFIIFSMPLPVIRHLQLPRQQKVMLTGVFCLGFFTCIISVYRITTLRAASDSPDPTWDNTDAAVWSVLELSMGVLAACLPTLKPLLAPLLPRLFKSSTAGRTGNVYGDYGRRSHATRVPGGGASSTRRIAPGAHHHKFADHDYYGDMDDTNASSGSVGLGATELPVYHVSVTGGGGYERDAGKGGQRQPGRDVFGIQTTTVVTQRVDSL